MPSEYDISRAFKRIENDLMDSMMRNLKRHQVEENELGITWEQWQVLQLQELEQYRQNNLKKFSKDFRDIDQRVDELFRQTANNAQSKEEHDLLEKIKTKQFTPDVDKGGFFRLNEPKLEALIMATQSDFVRAEYAMLRKANDEYRKIIFDAMTYANVTNDYKKAVDMATKDFLQAGINCVEYRSKTDPTKVVARHQPSTYASMALRTGNKRAYLMGEGNAHDKYGLHYVRVNKRQDACPKCVGFLGKVLCDDVYGGGTRAEANKLGVPTLSDAIQAGFLHPNCKDMYSVYIPGVSKEAKPWTEQEIGDIVGEYNQEQEIKHAQDMQETYQRMAKYSLDPSNQAMYQKRADDWGTRITEIQGTPPVVLTEEERLRNRLAELETQKQTKDAELQNAIAERKQWETITNAYDAIEIEADVTKRSVKEIAEEWLKEAQRKYTEDPSEWRKESVGRYQLIVDNPNKFKNGVHLKKIEALTAKEETLKGELSTIDKERAIAQQKQRTMVATQNATQNNLRELPYKKVTDPETAEQLLSRVNPNYPKQGYTRNCQRTVIAEELRYRGYDVVAKARAEDALADRALRGFVVPQKWWEDPEFGFVQKKSLVKDIEAQFAQWGDDARAIMRVKWNTKYGGNGHFVFVRKENGAIIIEDPQTNKIRDAKELMSKITQSSKQNWIIRVDNREVSNLIDLAVENRQ